MNDLFLFGKDYSDTIMFVESNKEGETNSCSNIVQKQGGVANFFEVKFNNWKLNPITTGEKKAYIVSDRTTSTRTSYVLNQSPSIMSEQSINAINQGTWLHVCYIDDIECYSELSKIKIPYSIDFCTELSREMYTHVMQSAKIIFDSRERKALYNNITLKTPLVLHDAAGFEIIEKGKIIHKESQKPLKNLNVNGAGDIYAAFAINNYYSRGLIDSTKNAMVETTNLLINRTKNEQKV